MNNVLPDGWGYESLTNLSTFRRGSFPQPYGSPEWYDDNGFPFVQIYDLGASNLLKPYTKVRISKIAAEKSVFVPKGTVIVSIQGSIGRVVVTQYDAYVDRTILIFTDIFAHVNRDFFALMVREIFELKKNEADGGVIKTITKETLKNFLMIVPPLPEQQKIAKILTSVDEVIEKTQAQIDKLKDLKIGMMQELLTNGIGHTEFKDSPVGRIPAEWEVYELGQLASKIEGGGTPSKNEPLYWAGEIPWASVKDLKEVKLSLTQEYISQLGLDNSACKLIPANTMILASRMAVGKAVMFDKDVAINQDLKAFYPKKNLDSQFLLHWYLSKADYIESLGTGSTVKGIRLDDLKILNIALPPLMEQRKLASIFTSIDATINKKKSTIKIILNTKKALMQDLLTGKVRVKTESTNTEVAVG